MRDAGVIQTDRSLNVRHAEAGLKRHQRFVVGPVIDPKGCSEVTMPKRNIQASKMPGHAVYSNPAVFLGLKVDNLYMHEAVKEIAQTIEGRRFCYAVTPNVDHVIQLRHDDSFRESYRCARFCFADGVPLVWAASLLGSPLKGRVNGTDLFEELCKMAADRGHSIFLLGGNPGTAEGTVRVLLDRYPRIKVAGWECPRLGFDKCPDECIAIQQRICSTKADLLFVALGAPKQEDWMRTYGPGTGVAFAIGIGVSLSFISGEICRAPLWMQRHGFEWFWRLLHEPTRLWKRYLLKDLVFIPLVFLAWVEQVLLRSLGASETKRTG